MCFMSLLGKRTLKQWRLRLCMGYYDVLSVRAGGRTFHPRSFLLSLLTVFFCLVWLILLFCLVGFVWVCCVFVLLFVLVCCVVNSATVKRSTFLDAGNPILGLIRCNPAAQSLVSTLLLLCCGHGVALYFDSRHFSHGLPVS